MQSGTFGARRSVGSEPATRLKEPRPEVMQAMTFEETLTVLLGCVGRRVEVVIRSADARYVVAGFGGDLHRAQDTYKELRG
jgi:hypothetical protein